MTDECVDLLVIGGGINGTGIARDACGRGLSVTLVEQGDLAAATSSASTKLIHGGLRYLEFFDFRLVRESLIERERLLGLAPHLIRPLEFVLPHASHLRPRWQIRSGLFLYDHLGGRQRLPRSRSLHFPGTAHAHVLREEYRHGFAYSDCWVDDSRLVIANALDAAERGATVLTRTRFLGARPHDAKWQVELASADGRTKSSIHARCLVNAAGPWVEHVLRALPSARMQSQIRLVRGSHIVVPRLYEGAHAYLLQHPDKRVVFTIPYESDYTLVGTTDVTHHGDPAHPEITTPEVTYLCELVARYFRQPPRPSDVRWSYSGVRPLLDDDAQEASRITRDYRLELTVSQGAPVLSVFGGKLTTYRQLAESAVNKITAHFGRSAPAWTATAPLPGGDLPGGDFPAALRGVQRQWPFLDHPLAYRLLRAYGSRLNRILGTAQRLQDLGTHYGAGLTEAEVSYLRRDEWAQTADDILWRRTKLGLHLSSEQRRALLADLEPA